MKIFIYGTGRGAVKFYNSLKKNMVQLLGFLDSDRNKEGNEFLGKEIFYPKTIKKIDYDYIIIASQYTEIYDFLLSLGFKDSKLIQVYKFVFSIEQKIEKNKILSKISNQFCEEYIVTKKMFLKKDEYLEQDFNKYFDYVRYKTLQLVVNEIYAYDIKGEVAEVGVHKGDFAKIINSCFKDRKLYLFDTFEGFDENEKDYDLKNNYTSAKFLNEIDFKDTNIDIVLGKMKHIDNCTIKKGYFPDTAIGLNKRFAFVSIDVDLFKPTYNSLEFFYPRLNVGGYIFIHDYNNKDFFGVRKAVEKFESKNGKIKKVPLCDSGGTLIITK